MAAASQWDVPLATSAVGMTRPSLRRPCSTELLRAGQAGRAAASGVPNALDRGGCRPEPKRSQAAWAAGEKRGNGRGGGRQAQGMGFGPNAQS